LEQASVGTTIISLGLYCTI